jgi:hypothetical protein
LDHLACERFSLNLLAIKPPENVPKPPAGMTRSPANKLQLFETRKKSMTSLQNDQSLIFHSNMEEIKYL